MPQYNYLKSNTKIAIFTHFSLVINEEPLFDARRKVNFHNIIFRHFRVSTFQKSMIRLNENCFKFHHFWCSKMEWPICGK